MRLLRIISLTLSIALITSVCFVNADEGYIDGNKIVINGITYENKESAFSKIKTSTAKGVSGASDTYDKLNTAGLGDYFLDDVKENKYSNADGKTVIPEIGSTDGKSITPKILCTTPSSEDCVSVWYLTTEAIGEPVRGSFYEQVPLWQKLSYDGKVYYTPVDGLDYGGDIDKVQVYLASLTESKTESQYFSDYGKTTTPKFIYQPTNKWDIVKAYISVPGDALNSKLIQAENWVTDKINPVTNFLGGVEYEVSNFMEHNKYIPGKVKRLYFRGNGITLALADSVSGIYGMARHPWEATKGIFGAVYNWRDTGKVIYTGAKNYVINFCTGTDAECYIQQGHLIGAVAETVVGGTVFKGVSKVNKISQVAPLTTRITHYGTSSIIKTKSTAGVLKPYKPRWFGGLSSNNVGSLSESFLRKVQHSKPVTWVQIGEPSTLKRITTGMWGKKGKSYITMDVPTELIKQPDGLLYKFRGKNIGVIEEAVPIPKNAKFNIPKRSIAEQFTRNAEYKLYKWQKGSAIESLIDDYSKLKPRFDNNIKTIGQKLHIDFENGPIKTFDRIAEKSFKEYGNNLNKINDVMRSSFIIDKVSDAEKIIKQIKETFGSNSIYGNIVDNFVSPGKQTNFRNKLIKIDIGDGKRAEIQIVPRDVYQVKKKTHDIYSELRTLKDNFYENPRVSELQTAIKKENDIAWSDFQKRDIKLLNNDIKDYAKISNNKIGKLAPEMKIYPQVNIQETKKWYQFWK